MQDEGAAKTAPFVFWGELFRKKPRLHGCSIMNGRILSAGLLAVGIAASAIVTPPLLRAQTSNQSRVPRVIDLFYNDAIGAPVPPLAVAQVATADTAEDAKATARRFAQGAIPAIAGSDMALTDWTAVHFSADQDGNTHTRLQQTIGGLRVFGAEVAVHLDGSNIVGLNGEAVVDLDISLKPSISYEAAAKAARVAMELPDRLAIESAQLVIYNPAVIDQGPSANYLAYHLVLSNAARDESYTALVDARAAKLLNAFNNIESARSRDTRDLGNSRVLPGSPCHTESAPVNGATQHGDCLAAHRYAGDTYDYFNRLFARDSYDNAGATMTSSVRYGATANAFWNGRQTAFGPGFATKDVVAHEWTHAITASTARLIYLNQSGALNESMSDIFAALIDADDWTLGEDLAGGAIRSLADPTLFGDPGKVSDSQFVCGPADNGGVHSNSGVPNHAAYLMAQGGSYNGVSVTAIGRDSTAKVFYRALTTYLTPGSNFMDAYRAIETACTDLQGAAGGIPAGSCTQVTAALQAVEMNVSACAISGTGTPDTFEDDDAPTASRVTGRTYSTPEQHTFHDAGDADWVRFTVAAGATLRFETSNLQSSADTIVRLYGTNGTSVLAEDDDTGAGLGSRLDYTFTTAGNYFVRVVQYNEAVFGDNTGYTLTLTTTTSTGDAFEPDNSTTTARTIAVGAVHTGHTYGEAGDNDWKSFTATANAAYVISTENLLFSSDTYLLLYRLDGATPVLLAADDDSGSGLGSRIEWVAPAAGTYYIRSRHYSSTVFGPNTGYDLRLATTTVAGDSFESDNTRADARSIALDTIQQHTSHVQSDHDWVVFAATGGTTYTFQTTIAAGSRSDTILDLYDANGTLITTNDDSAGTMQSTIVHTPSGSGNLFARVRQFNPGVYGSQATYALRVTSTACTGADSNEPNDSIATATAYTGGSTQSHNHACAGDRDFIRFAASRNMDYDIRTFALGTGADTVMTLLDSSGAVLALNDDGGGGAASRIAFRAPSDGNFFVMVRHFAPSAMGTTTNYSFMITSSGTSGTADSFENDDTQATADPITIAAPHANHNFHAAGDADWISFATTAGANYVVQTVNLGQYADTIVEVYNGTTLLIRDDDGGGGLASRAAFSAPSGGGTVHFKVFHFNAQQFGSSTNYDVRVSTATSTTTGDAFEPDNTPAQTSTLTTSAAQLHDFHAAGDVDFARFTAAANTTYTIFTANLGPSSDTFLDLYQSDGTTLITSNDDRGGGVASRIVYTPTAAGDLVVRVRHYSSTVSGSGTQYELRLGAVAASAGDAFEADNTSAAARLISVGAAAETHNFHLGGDEDWLKFNATSGSTYALETSNLGIRADTVLTLYDTTGTRPERVNDDFGSTLASRIEFTASTTGTYFIRVTHFSPNVAGDGTNYDFRIQLVAGCTAGDTFEPDSTPAQAGSLAVGATQTGRTIGCAGDVDWIRLTGLAAGARYTLETFDLGSTADTVLTLFNSTASTVLAENDDSGGTVASRLEFSTSASGWTQHASMPTARAWGSVGVVNNIIYVGGGDTFSTYTNVLEAYNPTTNTWTTRAAPPGDQAAAATGVHQNKIYVAGGHIGDGVPIGTTRVYDAAANTWSSLANMPTARRDMSGGMINGVFYVPGGSPVSGRGGGFPTAVHEAYDVATNTWSSKPAMIEARHGFAAGVIDGKLYVAGGIGSNSPRETAEVFDPTANQGAGAWSALPPMPSARAYANGVVLNGKLYVIGGISSDGSLSAIVRVFDPATNTWSTSNDIPTPRVAAMAATANNRIYYIGGSRDFGSPSAEVHSFSPAIAGDTERFVRVRHFSPTASGATTSYSIRLQNLSTTTADTHESDDTSATAKTLTTSAAHTGTTAHNFHVAGDVDWISLTAPANQTCVFETFNLGSRSDTVMRLFASNGTTQLAVDDDSGTAAFASRISYAFTTGGTHFLKLQHFSATTGGVGTDYSVRFSCSSSSNDVLEPNNTFAQANTIAVNGATQLAFHGVNGDQDWARFTATAGTSYVFETFDLANSADTQLSLYDTNGTTLLRQDDDGGPGLASYLAWTAPASGDYYLQVRRYCDCISGPDTAYSLRVRTGTPNSQPHVEVTAEDGPLPGTVQLLVRPLEPADEMKVELLAKPELLAFAGARSLLATKGDAVAPVRLIDSAAYQPGMMGLYLEGKQLEQPSGGGNVVAIDYQLVRPLPHRKTTVHARVTLIDAAGNVTVDVIETTVNSLDGQPRVESFSPGTVEEGQTRTVEVRGSDFDRPKAFLVAGGSEFAMLDVAYRDDGTWLEFVVPGNMRAGAYGIRVRNNDNSSSDSEQALVIGNTCDFSLSREVLTVRGSGGTDSVTVSTGNGCQWTPQSQAAWVHVTTPTDSATGTGTMSFVVDPAPAGGRPNAVVTVVAGGAATGTRTLTIVQPPNSNPTFSSIGNQSVQLGSELGPIAFTITDDDDDAVTISASSSNQTVIPNGNIMLANAGAHRLAADSIFAVLNRTIRITPAALGQATITLVAGDGRGGTATTTFVVTVSETPVLRPPTDVRASADGTMVTVQWTAPSSGPTPTGYRVEAGLASGAADISMDVGITDRLTINIGVIGRVFVRVKSLRNTEVSAASNEAMVQIGTPIGSPQSFAATRSGNTVTLTWAPPLTGTAATYVLQAGTTPGGVNLGNFPLGNTLSVTVPNVPNGTYFLRLFALTAANDVSAPSNEVRVDVGPVDPPPGAPQNFAVTASGNTVTLTWSPPASGGVPTTYVLEAGSAPGLSNLAAGVVVGNILSFTAPGVPDGRYFVRVRAANAAGLGAASNEVDVIVGTTQSPGAPSALSRTVVGNTVTLVWAAPTTGGPVTTYVIDAGSGPGLSNLAQAVVGNTTTISASVPAGRYFVRVRAVNALGSSAASNEVIVDVP